MAGSRDRGQCKLGSREDDESINVLNVKSDDDIMRGVFRTSEVGVVMSS